MLINMTAGGTGAQMYPFTVESLTYIYYTPYTINNVKIPKGTVKGFVILPNGSIVLGNGAIMEINKSSYVEQASGLVEAVAYYSAGQNQRNNYVPSTGTDFEYNPSTETFKFMVRFQGATGDAYLPAGDYILVIW